MPRRIRLALQDACADRARRGRGAGPRDPGGLLQLHGRQVYLRAGGRLLMVGARLLYTVPRRLRSAYRGAPMPLSRELRTMSDRITRNLIVARLGTPDQTEGSLNNPV